MKTFVRLLVAAVAVAALSAPTAPAQGRPGSPRSFVLLLKGVYEPVADGPDLGLSLIDLGDGSYSKTRIYDPSSPKSPIGNFYFNDATGDRCAYELPDGTFAALVEEINFEVVEVEGGWLFVGTADLSIPEATGAYEPFVGGSIHMAFAAFLTEEFFDEYCYCIVRR